MRYYEKQTMKNKRWTMHNGWYKEHMNQETRSL